MKAVYSLFLSLVILGAVVTGAEATATSSGGITFNPCNGHEIDLVFNVITRPAIGSPAIMITGGKGLDIVTGAAYTVTFMPGVEGSPSYNNILILNSSTGPNFTGHVQVHINPATGAVEVTMLTFRCGP